MNLRYFVLGLLAQQPMSGYDIKRFLKGLRWLIGSPSAGSLYPILRALLEEGLVTVEVVPSMDRPPRKIYSIKESGRQVLQAWIDRSIVSNASLKTFVMRLILAGVFSPAVLSAHLRQRRAQVAGHQATLKETIMALGVERDIGQRLALNYGLALAAAELDWLDGILGELSETLLSGEEGVRESVSYIA